MSAFEDVRSWVRRRGAPVSLALAVSFLLAFLLALARQEPVGSGLALVPGWTHRPWMLLTYPWAPIPLADPMDVLWIGLELYFVYWFGSAVEREIGSAKYLAFFLVMTVLGGAFAGIGGRLSYVIWTVAGPALPSAAIVVAWCNRNPTATLRLWMTIPLRSAWLGWVVGLLLFLTYVQFSLLMAAFSCLHLIAAWAYSTPRFKLGFGSIGPQANFSKEPPIRKGAVVYDEKYYDDVKRREKERQEQERLRKLLGDDDPS